MLLRNQGGNYLIFAALRGQYEKEFLPSAGSGARVWSLRAFQALAQIKLYGKAVKAFVLRNFSLTVVTLIIIRNDEGTVGMEPAQISHHTLRRARALVMNVLRPRGFIPTLKLPKKSQNEGWNGAETARSAEPTRRAGLLSARQRTRQGGALSARNAQGCDAERIWQEDHLASKRAQSAREW
eukprot:2391906-Rhodomonas_salina.2